MLVSRFAFLGEGAAATWTLGLVNEFGGVFPISGGAFPISGGVISAVVDLDIGREFAVEAAATHWLVKSSKISFGNSRPSAARKEVILQWIS